MVDGAKLKVATWITTPFAVSRDGNTVVFTANDSSGDHLWVRTLDQPNPRPLADTDGAYQPAISPDGEWVAFVVANHVIRKSRLSGGGVTTVTTTDDLTAALAWTSNDEIIFERIGSDSGIERVSANGGAPQVLIPIDKGAGEIVDGNAQDPRRRDHLARWQPRPPARRGPAGNTAAVGFRVRARQDSRPFGDERYGPGAGQVTCRGEVASRWSNGSSLTWPTDRGSGVPAS